ncbi:aa3-type cytochrome c oxidase subunit IV [Xanthobacter sp. KR7-225]|uniref:aa3-type cytochrome c oxidase subunit IV n=1 Tax=Xanthobacter sp. KR7-225 TaxID=3156613 RepID=UPI0032B57A2A
MADHGTIEYGHAEGNDYVEHERTYEMFTSLTKWASIAIAVILVLMWIFLL